MSDKIRKTARTLRLTAAATYYTSKATRRSPASGGICVFFSGEKEQDAFLIEVMECLTSYEKAVDMTKSSHVIPKRRVPGLFQRAGRKNLSGAVAYDGALRELLSSGITLAVTKKPCATVAERFPGARAVSASSQAGRRALTQSRLILTSVPLPEAFVPASGQKVVSVFGKRLKKEAASPAAFPFDRRQRTFFHSQVILVPDQDTAAALAVIYGLRGIYRGKIVDTSSIGTADLSKGLLEDPDSLPSACSYPADRKRLLFYAGPLQRNGITSSLKNLLGFLPDDTDAYLCTLNLKDNVPYPDLTDFAITGLIDIRDLPSMTLTEMPAAIEYYVRKRDTPAVLKTIRRIFSRELTRVLPGITFDAVIHFDGYGRYMMGLMGRMAGKKTIFVHNDLVREIAQKGRQHLPSHREAYTTFDHIAVVSEALIGPTRALAGEGPDIRVVPNCHDFAGIRERAKLPISPDPDTDVTLTGWDTIDAFLAGHSLNLITIGRFSPEKNHAMILEAFERFRETHPGTGLTVIGGYGELYEETRARFTSSPAAGDLCLIRSISNPMPILSRCDLFILASSYEGQPMVLAEAGCLGIPAIAAATRGSREFMEKWDGTLVDCSVEGLLEGMEDFMAGKVHPVRMDYDHYNEDCLKAFLELVK